MSASIWAMTVSCRHQAAARARSWCPTSTTVTGASVSTARGASSYPTARQFRPLASNRAPARRAGPRPAVLALVLLSFGSMMGAPVAATDLSLESAEAVNEGSLRFLATLPAKPVPHHQNRGWYVRFLML